MKLTDIRGLKYPDDYFIKYFFKHGFHATQRLTFLEFGSSNGNNLILPYQFNHNVIGVDFDQQSIENAHYNFKHLEGKGSAKTCAMDMCQFAKENKNLKADVFSLPNVINYISKPAFEDFLQTMIANNNIKKEASLFLRCRSPKDFRFGIGEKVGPNTYQLADNYTTTGEAGCLNAFYDDFELIILMQKYLNLKDFTILHCDFQNIQNDTLISNSDIILWGTIN